MMGFGIWSSRPWRIAPRSGQRVRSRREQRERLERDADALSEHYAEMVRQTLNSLTSKELHGINNMLQPRVVASADGPLEITDVFGQPLEACALRL
jgi:hypothetical protein